jgi:hypothetical protein
MDYNLLVRSGDRFALMPAAMNAVAQSVAHGAGNA